MVNVLWVAAGVLVGFIAGYFIGGYIEKRETINALAELAKKSKRQRRKSIRHGADGIGFYEASEADDPEVSM